MNADEAAALLAHCSGFDNRQPSVAAAKSWASALRDVPFDQDARDAVAAYYTTPPQNPNDRLWILPHHVRTLRSKIRSVRLENFQYEPRADETTAEYLARYRSQVQAIASGRVAAPADRLALEGGPSKQFMEELEAHGWQGNRTVPDPDEPVEAELIDTVRRSGPLGVECPVDVCRAAVGRPCRTPGGSSKQPLGKPRVKPHSARVRAASGQRERIDAERAAEEQRIREASARHLARMEAEEEIPDAEIVEPGGAS
ncbi:zinc finger domain-containing protein [Streptomyces malaysiensis]|uniref:zinc finger domain-containing protein n=1 Tax=Streptomyces malaysiensis TaxID=92644 RepID=UPI0036816DEE